nr:collagen alpha-1(I) chain-like [Taeniopygia guttata]
MAEHPLAARRSPAALGTHGPRTGTGTGREPRQPGWRRAEPPAVPASSSRSTEPAPSAAAPPGAPGSLPEGSAPAFPLAGSASRHGESPPRLSPGPAAAVPGPAVLRSALLTFTFTFTCRLATPHPRGWGPRRASSGPGPRSLPAFPGKEPAASARRSLPQEHPPVPIAEKNLPGAVSAEEAAERSSAVPEAAAGHAGALLREAAARPGGDRNGTSVQEQDFSSCHGSLNHGRGELSNPGPTSCCIMQVSAEEELTKDHLLPVSVLLPPPQLQCPSRGSVLVPLQDPISILMVPHSTSQVTQKHHPGTSLPQKRPAFGA